MASYLDIKDIKKAYGEGGGYNQVLKGITTQVEKGEMCVILGPSGCGKSTFLNAIGGLDTVDTGSILVDGLEIVDLKPAELARYRKENLGFVFQFYNLVGDLAVKENIQICEHLATDPLDMDELLDILGLTAMAKRIPRKLKAKWPRYLALFAMVTLSVYVFLGMMASSYSVMNGVLASDQEHKLESGQFSAIEPLSDEELAHLQDMGVEVEAAFSQDFTQEDGTLLRVYTVRQGIDTIALEKGALPAADGELVLEQSFARVHGIQLGDSVLIAGMPFTVAGTGSTPDFESPRKSLTNPASDTTTFGLVYVTPSAYQALLDTGMADRAQELLYHYRLGEGVTDADVNDYVGGLLFDSLKAQDDFVRESVPCTPWASRGAR
ncbi:MAG: ABC transporter ATP-binding protein [Coriobacteriales bacterium]